MKIQIIIIILVIINMCLLFKNIKLQQYILNYNRIIKVLKENNFSDKDSIISSLKLLKKNKDFIIKINNLLEYVLIFLLYIIFKKIELDILYEDILKIFIILLAIHLIVNIFERYSNKNLDKLQLDIKYINFLENIKIFDFEKTIEEDKTTDDIKRSVLEDNFEDNFEEKEMLLGAFEIGKTNVSEILTPRRELYAISGDTTINENWNEILEQGFSRIPVYIDNIDNIVGILYLKDILKYKIKNDEDIKVKKLIRKPYFIPGTKKLPELLTEFQKTQNHMAIIIDEYGGTEGIITIEDILEEIVGEIRDEYDEEEEKVIQLSERVYEVSGDKLIEEINEELNLNIPISEEYDTISGYFLYKLGRIAKIDDVVRNEKSILKVIEIDNMKIEKIKIILL